MKSTIHRKQLLLLNNLEPSPHPARRREELTGGLDKPERHCFYCGCAYFHAERPACLKHWRLTPYSLRLELITNPDSDREAYVSAQAQATQALREQERRAIQEPIEQGKAIVAILKSDPCSNIEVRKLSSQLSWRVTWLGSVEAYCDLNYRERQWKIEPSIYFPPGLREDLEKAVGRVVERVEG